MTPYARNKYTSYIYEEFHRKTGYDPVGWIMRYLILNLLKYKENNKNICNTFDHNFKNIPLYVMRKVSLERYFVLYDGALTYTISQLMLNPFCDGTLHI